MGLTRVLSPSNWPLFNFDSGNKSLENLRGFDCNTSFLFVFSSVCSSGFTSFGWGNDTGFGQKRISQRRFAVIDVSNNRHVSDIVLFVHNGTDLVYGEVHLGKESEKITISNILSQNVKSFKVISGEICFLSSFFRTGLWIFIINIAKIKEKVEIFYLKLFTIKRNLNEIDKSSRNSN